MLASAVIDQVRYLLQDVTVGGLRWLDAEMIVWVNAGQKEIARYKPDASVTNASVVLVAGTKQTLPAGATHLIKVTRNMGAAGTTPGAAVRIVEAEIMDAQNPNWHADTPAGTVEHYILDLRDPLTYYVYPPQPATPTYVEVVYASAPADITAIGDDITIPDVHSNALVDYVMYRALSKDATYTKSGVDADSYLKVFLAAMGIFNQIQASVDPNNQVGNPNANLAAARG
jgi:hypothetical protein